MSNKKKEFMVRTLFDRNIGTLIQMTRNGGAQWQSIAFESEEELIAFRREMNRHISEVVKS